MREVAENFNDIKVLKPIKGWDSEELDLISTSGSNYTALGVTKVWSAIGSAIKYWDTHKANPLHLHGYATVPSALTKKTSSQFHHKQFDRRHDKFHWNKF